LWNCHELQFGWCTLLGAVEEKGSLFGKEAWEHASNLLRVPRLLPGNHHRLPLRYCIPDKAPFFLLSCNLVTGVYSSTYVFLLFQLKELEKMGPRKGVIAQSVKDVVQSLVDDDLVSKDKIGTSVSYHPKQWRSFPLLVSSDVFLEYLTPVSAMYRLKSITYFKN